MYCVFVINNQKHGTYNSLALLSLQITLITGRTHQVIKQANNKKVTMPG